jgi:DNA-directed RNA polymerase specialized sigma24 family protein
MSTTNLIQEKFLEAYDSTADDIFEYCYSETSHRDMAKYLTRNIFAETWDMISYYGLDSVRNIRKLIFRTAKSHIAEFISAKKNEMNYYDNLWNLTLSQ